MGIGGTASCNKRKNLTLVHLHCLTGRKVIRQQNHRLIRNDSLLIRA